MLDDLRVVEVEGSIAGGYAAKLLADHGAAVTTVRAGRPASEPWSDGLRRYLNHAKTEVSVLSEELLAGADVVIESSPVDPLVPAHLPDVGQRHRIALTISPFGPTGPYAERRSTDLTDQAISGHLYLNGDPGRESRSVAPCTRWPSLLGPTGPSGSSLRSPLGPRSGRGSGSP